MRRLLAAVIVGAIWSFAASSGAQATSCGRQDGTPLRDVYWQNGQRKHPLIAKVFKGDQPIAIPPGDCIRSPLQQLIVEVWDAIASGGIVLLGEVHDNPEHHAVRGDILRPRLDNVLPMRDLKPAAVFEHIRTSQQAQLDRFYREAARSPSLLGAADLLRELAWKSSGWPAGELFYPLFDAALSARQPIYPGNAVRERMRLLVRGQTEPTDAEVASLKLAQALPQPLLDALGTELEGSHCGALPPTAIPSMSLAQRYTDAHMAKALADAAARHGAAFLLAGNGHVRTDRGVPWYVHRLAAQRKTLAVMFLEVEAEQNDAATYLTRGPDGAAAADYFVFTPRQDRPDPCEKMSSGKP